MEGLVASKAAHGAGAPAMRSTQMVDAARANQELAAHGNERDRHRDHVAAEVRAGAGSARGRSLVAAQEVRKAAATY